MHQAINSAGNYSYMSENIFEKAIMFRPSNYVQTKLLWCSYQDIMFILGHYVQTRPLCSDQDIMFRLGHYVQTRPLCSDQDIMFRPSYCDVHTKT